ncbi:MULTISPECIES: DUF7511 domain-containing protein [Halolamina]|uniref:DUF7511 domain-containing protein n=1 Tax=Halolamina pelagica TaxID=699431 RepID=A0A1I5M5V6_9EURY|nr:MULTISPECIES: hypothetical protein [Halolamina]NHX35879.1 hypothetical protein [Halolamina sp. R1-12]SFP04952.1 hypothetical protein SAMN05216277_101117 [Halolamina pelagica]
MSVRQTPSGELLGSYPDFGLSCRYDDDDDPSEVTLFPGEEMSTTEWVTADLDSAVSLDEIR